MEVKFLILHKLSEIKVKKMINNVLINLWEMIVNKIM